MCLFKFQLSCFILMFFFFFIPLLMLFLNLPSFMEHEMSALLIKNKTIIPSISGNIRFINTSNNWSLQLTLTIQSNNHNIE